MRKPAHALILHPQGLDLNQMQGYLLKTILQSREGEVERVF